MNNQEKNPVWIVEGHYQYLNFKEIIDYTGYDVYSLFTSTEKGSRANKKLFRLDDTEVDITTMREKYSVIIKTGSALLNLAGGLDYLSIVTNKKIIQIAHSIIGAQGVDLCASLPIINKKMICGMYPLPWMNNKLIQQRFERVKERGNTVQSMRYHPYILNVLSPDTAPPELNTLGLSLSFKSINIKFVDKVMIGLEKRQHVYDAIYIKRHPLHNGSSQKYFAESDLKKWSRLITAFETNSPKYEFTDRCESLVTGVSSMFVEAHLRNLYYKKNQKIYALNETNRINLAGGSGYADIPFSDNGVEFTDWNDNIDPQPYSQYADFLNFSNRQDIFDDFIDSLNTIMSTLMYNKPKSDNILVF